MFKKSVRDKFGILDFGDQDEEKIVEETAETIEDKVMKFGNKAKAPILETERTETRGEVENSTNDAIINKNTRLRIYKPTYYEVVQSIGRDIKGGKIVLLDMSSLDEKTTVKIIQFVYGLCFALDIEPEDVSPKIISVDPQNKTGN